MHNADHARREVARGIVAAGIAYVVIGIAMALLDMIGARHIMLVPITTGALLPAVFTAKCKDGTLHVITRPAKQVAGAALQARHEQADEANIVSIAPARRTGPITFEITTLEVPLDRRPCLSRCELHKGTIIAEAVSCKRCGAMYCKACAGQLASLGERCWACHHPLD